MPLTPVGGRNHGLDLLRGLAALGITAFHFLSDAGVEIQSLGTFGVYVFFVLSGLTMMLVYADRFASNIGRDDLIAFFWNRFSRIAPLLAAAALASLVMASADVGWNRHLVARALQSLLTATGLFAAHLPGYLSTVTGAWSLGIELAFYAVFPIVCLLAARARLSRLLVAILILVAAQQILLAILRHWQHEDFTRFWHYYATPLMFAPFFLVGITVFRLRSAKSRTALLGSLACAAGIATFSLACAVDVFEFPWAYLSLSALAGASVLFAWQADVPRPLIAAAAFLGNASYALYLVHPFFIPLSKALADAFALGMAARASLYFALSIGVAHCSFFCFERPAQRYLRGLLLATRIAGVPRSNVATAQAPAVSLG
ncbi:MAG: acyltransferase [Xanthobacteraceae bacterium]|nr:acyltransferase [Xanthobacteraceae bacterium]